MKKNILIGLLVIMIAYLAVNAFNLQTELDRATETPPLPMHVLCSPNT